MRRNGGGDCHDLVGNVNQTAIDFLIPTFFVFQIILRHRLNLDSTEHFHIVYSRHIDRLWLHRGVEMESCVFHVF